MRNEDRSRIALYRDKTGGYSTFRSASGAAPDKDGFLELASGDAISSVPSVLRPYREDFTDFPADRNGVAGSGYIEVPVAPPAGSVSPPEGFAALPGLRFPRAGRYQVQAELDLHAWTRTPRPREKFVPRFLVNLLALLDLYHEAKPADFDVNIKSAPVLIEVAE